MIDHYVAVIGVGGRTGTMFAYELSKAADVLGVGLKKEIEEIKKNNLWLKSGEEIKVFEGKVIEASQFGKGSLPEIIFLCTKNPVYPVVKYYYQIIKEKAEGKIPSLVLSQNGIWAGEEARNALSEIFDDRAEKIQIIRISLFNPVFTEKINGKSCISYLLPVRLAFGVYSGPEGTERIKEIFNKAGIRAVEVAKKDVKSMEFSKLFLNLIGMPSASKGLSLRDGFLEKETFKEELGCLREYIKLVKKAKGKFLNFPHLPVKTFALFVSCLPSFVLFLLRRKIVKLISKEREGKPKDLGEVDYYNGSVLKLARELGERALINQRVYQRIKAKISSHRI